MDYYEKSYTSIVAAMGDTGKGMLLLDLALKVISDKDQICSFGSFVTEHGSVVIFSAEDDASEIHRRLASNKMNLSNQEETHQFKFLVVLSIVVKEAPHAVITGIFTGAISARRLAWFWRNGQIIDGVLRLPRLGDCIISTVPS